MLAGCAPPIFSVVYERPAAPLAPEDPGAYFKPIWKNDFGGIG